MKKIKFVLQFVQWIWLYFVLTPRQRRLLRGRFILRSR